MFDNEEKLKCPACGKEMRKFYIPEMNINLDICIAGCGGIYFDNRELEKLNKETNDVQELFKMLENKQFEQVDTSLERVCPICNTVMMKQGAANGIIEVDICATCGGKFLDANELQVIKNTKDENSDDSTNNIIELLYNENLPKNSVNVALPGYKKRIEFFRNLASKYIVK